VFVPSVLLPLVMSVKLTNSYCVVLGLRIEHATHMFMFSSPPSHQFGEAGVDVGVINDSKVVNVALSVGTCWSSGWYFAGTSQGRNAKRDSRRHSSKWRQAGPGLRALDSL